ncbi:MAG: DUF721 domain-containing protein [Armatimonadota bacterium]|nr:DUF721 domain-containing protein [Armatimonadota bacterium]
MAVRGTRHPVPVGGALRAAFAKLGLSRRLHEVQAVAVWPEVAGPHIAAATRALWVRDGILWVATRSSAWSHELIHQKAVLLARLHGRVGKKVPTDIRFVSRGYVETREAEPAGPPWPGAADWAAVELTPEDEEAIQHILEPIHDPVLRARVKRVLIHNRRVERWKQAHGWRVCVGCGVAHAGQGDLCSLCRPPQAGP